MLLEPGATAAGTDVLHSVCVILRIIGVSRVGFLWFRRLRYGVCGRLGWGRGKQSPRILQQGSSPRTHQTVVANFDREDVLEEAANELFCCQGTKPNLISC